MIFYSSNFEPAVTSRLVWYLIPNCSSATTAVECLPPSNGDKKPSNMIKSIQLKICDFDSAPSLLSGRRPKIIGFKATKICEKSGSNL